MPIPTLRKEVQLFAPAVHQRKLLPSLHSEALQATCDWIPAFQLCKSWHSPALWCQKGHTVGSRPAEDYDKALATR